MIDKVLLALLLNAGVFIESFGSNPILKKKPSFLSAEKKTVFIDGSEGTTGLQVRERLSSRTDLEILQPPSELRKDEATRREYINKADAVILCLPDAASKEAASFVEEENDNTVLIDASTAFRVNEDWTYGFPELSANQREAICKSKRIANPGCYPTGFIGLIRPLVDAGLVKEGTKLTVNAISGYSGGGKPLMKLFEEESDDAEPWSAYGFTLKHKHVPEMTKYSGLKSKPIFQPQIAKFPQGMVVSVPIHYSLLKEGTTGQQIHDVLSKHYESSTFVNVMPLSSAEDSNVDYFERNVFLRPDALANTNYMQLFVFDNDDDGMAVLCARLDNLGKGASGAAVQNLNLALGLDEMEGLL